MQLLLIIVIVILVVFLGYMISTAHEKRNVANTIRARSKDMNTVTITTPYDHSHTIAIKGNYWHGGADKGIILLHMMPSTKESWQQFAKKLHKKGYHVLAIDERGHGESIVIRDTKGNTRSVSYKDFSDEEHASKIKDIDAAYTFLIEKGVSRENIVVAGASIGANLTLVFMEQHADVKKGILLSPGMDYRSVRTDMALRNLTTEQHIDISAAREDIGSAQSVETLEHQRPESVTATLFDGKEHGTDLLKKHPEFMEELITWLA